MTLFKREQAYLFLCAILLGLTFVFTMAQQARNPNTQATEAEIDSLTTLYMAGLVDIDQVQQRLLRGESLANAVNGSFSGRVKGNFERFVQDWQHLPDIVLFMEIFQAIGQSATNPMEQPLKTLSSLLLLGVILIGIGEIAIKISAMGLLGNMIARIPTGVATTTGTISVILNLSNPIGIPVGVTVDILSRINAKQGVKDRILLKSGTSTIGRWKMKTKSMWEK